MEAGSGIMDPIRKQTGVDAGAAWLIHDYRYLCRDSNFQWQNACHSSPVKNKNNARHFHQYLYYPRIDSTKGKAMKAVKLQYAEIDNAIKNLSDASYTKYKSHAYAAGYLQSQLATIMCDLPVKKQMEIVRNLQRTINDLQKV